MPSYLGQIKLGQIKNRKNKWQHFGMPFAVGSKMVIETN